MDVEAAFNTPHIVESLLRNLTAIDLCRCARVSKLWNHFATIELNKRKKKTVYFYQGLKCSFHKKGHRTVKECSLKTAGKFEESLDLQIRNLEVKPAFCIAFATLSFLEYFELLFPSHPISKPKNKKFKKEYDDTSREEYFKSVIKTALKKRLPRTCQVALYVEENVVNMNSHPDYVIYGKDSIPAISGYFFSKLPQQGLQFCSTKNHNRDLFRAMSTQSDKKSALVLMEHKTLGYCALGLKQNRKFNVFEKGIVFPVQYGSGDVPLFSGPNVETACFKIPFSNDQESERAAKMEKNGAIAFMFGKRNCYAVNWKDFHDYFPLIPIVGLWGYSEEDLESTNESKFYTDLIKRNVNLNFNCKCLLVSINY